MKKSKNETVVGLFVILGFVMLSVIVFFVSGVHFFRSGYTVNLFYDYVSILDKGAPVRMAGVRVGEVNRVKLAYDERKEKTRVLVKLFIEKGVEIRENYSFKIQGTHILSEPHIEISPQPGNAPLVMDQKTLEGENPVPIEGLIEHANRIAANLDAIFSNLRGAVEDEQSSEAVKKILVNLGELTRSLNLVLQGKEEQLRKSLDNIESTTESLSKILDTIEKGEGTLGGLMVRDELYQDIREFVAELKAHPWKLLKKDEEEDKKKKLNLF